MMKQIFKSLLFVVLVVPVGLGAMEEPDKIELGKELAAAADRKDWATVENLIAQGADQNQRDKDSWTPLMNAAKYGKEKITQLLIDIHADLNLQSKMGLTALFIAADSGQGKIVQMLIAAGAELNLADEKGMTPLLVVTNYHYLPKICYMLIEAMLAQNTKQKERIYTFLLCLKHVPRFTGNLPRDLFKPLLLAPIIDVRQEISRIENVYFRNQLLEKYGFQPSTNPEAQ